jgi:hypothetical protein
VAIRTLLLWFAPLSFGTLWLCSTLARGFGFASEEALGFVAVSTAILTVGFIWSRYCSAERERGVRIADSTKVAACLGFSYVHVVGYVILLGIPTAEPDSSFGARVAIVLILGIVFMTAVVPGMVLGEHLAQDAD